MSTERQIRANQQNAQKSTGPKSEAGKARSAQNARIHGFCAQSLVFPSQQEREQFRDRCQELSEQYPFEHAVKQSLITALAGAETQIRMINLAKRGLYRQILSGLGQGAQVPEPDTDAYMDLAADLLGCAFLRHDRNAEVILSLNRYELEQRRLFYKALHELEALAAKCKPIQATVVRTGGVSRQPSRRPANETKPVSPARKPARPIPDAA